MRPADNPIIITVCMSTAIYTKPRKLVHDESI